MSEQLRTQSIAETLVTPSLPQSDGTVISHEVFFRKPFAISQSLRDVASLVNEQSDVISRAYAKGKGRSLQGVTLSLHPLSGRSWQEVSGFLGELWFDGNWSYGLCAERESTGDRALIAGISFMPGDELFKYWADPHYRNITVENPSRTAIAVEFQAQTSQNSALDGMKEVVDSFSWDDYLLDAFIAWGRSINLDRVGVLPAALNKYPHKVPFERLKRRYDELAARHGFEPQEHGIYFLPLSDELAIAS